MLTKTQHWQTLRSHDYSCQYEQIYSDFHLFKHLFWAELLLATRVERDDAINWLYWPGKLSFLNWQTCYVWFATQSTGLKQSFVSLLSPCFSEIRSRGPLWLSMHTQTLFHPFHWQPIRLTRRLWDEGTGCAGMRTDSPVLGLHTDTDNEIRARPNLYDFISYFKRF